MFVLCTSRYAAPVKFTFFAPHIKLALKIYAVAIKALVKFTFFAMPFCAANTTASVACKSDQI